MEFSFISPGDMAVVMAIALIVFGPKRLPEVGRQLGGFVKELRKTMGQFSDAVEGVHSDVRSVIFDPSPGASEHASERGRGAESDLMKPYDPLDTARSAERIDQPQAVPVAHVVIESHDLAEVERRDQPQAVPIASAATQNREEHAPK